MTLARAASLVFLCSMGVLGDPAGGRAENWALTRPREEPGGGAIGLPQTVDQVVWHLIAHPDAGTGLLGLARLARRTPEATAQVEAQLRAAWAAAPADGRPVRALARVLAASRRDDEALAVLAAAVQQVSRPAPLLLAQARLLQTQGRSAEARVALEAAASARPTVAERRSVLTVLGALQIATADLAAARATYAQLDADPTLLARALGAAGAHAAAAAEWRALVDTAGIERAALRKWLVELGREALAAHDVDGALDAVARARAAGMGAERAALHALELEALQQGGRFAERALLLERDARAGEVGAWRRAAEAWAEQGNARRAVAAYRAFVARVPQDLAARAELAIQLLRVNERAEAERLLRGLVVRAPTEPRYFTELARLLWEGGRRREALVLLDGIERRSPGVAKVHAALRGIYEQWGEQERADRALTKLSALEPHASATVIARAERALALGDRAEAVRALGALRDGRGAAADAALRARAMTDRALIVEALAEAKRASALAPQDATYRRLLAELLERLELFEEAEVALQRLVDDARAAAAQRREAGQRLVGLWRRRGSVRAHEAALRDQLAEDPQHESARWLLAELYARDPARRAEEIRLREAICARQPHDLEARLALQRAYVRDGQIGAALAAGEPLITAGDARSEQVVELLALAEAHAQRAEVGPLIERALARFAAEPSVLRAVAAVLRRRGDDSGVRAALVRVTAAAPADREARLWLARDAWARGAAEEARSQLDALLDAPDERAVADAARLAQELDDAGFTLQLVARSEQGRLSPVLRRVLLARIASALAKNEGAHREAEDGAALAVRARRAVLAGLEGADDERADALAVLEAVALEHATGPLRVLAVRSDRRLAERARALVVYGHQSEDAAADHDRWFEAVDRVLWPQLLWALHRRGELTHELLDAALVDVDERIVVMAVLVADARVPVGLATDPRPAVRAAAMRVLARARPEALERAALEAALDEPAPVGTSAVEALAAQPGLLVRALFASDALVRRRAAQLLAHGRERAHPLPAPAYPFDVREMLEPAALGAGDRAVIPARIDDVAAPLLAATRAWLGEGASEQAPDLGLLVAAQGGLVPAALVEVRACVSRGLAERLAGSVRTRLAALGRADGPHAVRALALLVRGGGASEAVVLSALNEEGARRTAVLDALAELSRVPEALRAPVQQLLAPHYPWPIRRRAARALGTDAPGATLAREPIALVRAAAWAPKPQRAPACASHPAGDPAN